MNSDKSNSHSFKYQMFTPSGSKDIGIINLEFMASFQFPLKGCDQYTF